MLTGHLNATRFAQKPISMPAYSFANVPKAERDLKGSSCQFVDNREHFQASMAEMLLVCKEAMRRRPAAGPNGGSKPLSLEYIADRLDIDDPCFGYFVRTNENLQNDSKWKRGMLQGFITVTTFTNWQKSFRWDSEHEAAFFPDELEEQQSGKRRWDEDGSLAAGMQATVRCGDIWNEGIVWPRIAEISLLGGLGCGKALVSLAVEKLECMKASGLCNYDYVVLQATDNSVPFYESMGFVRVGAIMLDETADREREKAETPKDGNGTAAPMEIVTGDITSYTIRKAGETPNDIAKNMKLDVWDVIFLNKDIYKGIMPSSRLLAGTVLHIPVVAKPCPKDVRRGRSAEAENARKPQWHVAKEDETPREIAKLYDVSSKDVVEANKRRLPGLVSTARLKRGTRIKVSHLHILEEDFKPYSHWSFPDDRFEEGEPSYMMVRKLNRRRGNASRIRPVQESLAVLISDFEPTGLLLPPSSPPAVAPDRPPSVPPMVSAKKKAYSGEPVPPEQPLSAFQHFMTEQREFAREEGMSDAETRLIVRSLWDELPAKVKAQFDEQAEADRDRYDVEMENYRADLVAFDYEASGTGGPNSAVNPRESFFNKVVRLKPGALDESEYTYWYCLTFIPDLKWCHLAPMVQDGTFGPDKRKAEGRPKWKLVDEELGKEVDISSSYCIGIKSRAMKNTIDADREEWDIIDDGSDAWGRNPTPRKFNRKQSSSSQLSVPRNRASAPIKPSAKRVRVMRGELPPLLAYLPNSTRKNTTVKLVGKNLCDKDYDYPIKRARGRPRKLKSVNDSLVALEEESSRLKSSQADSKIVAEGTDSSKGTQKHQKEQKTGPASGTPFTLPSFGFFGSYSAPSKLSSRATAAARGLFNALPRQLQLGSQELSFQMLKQRACHGSHHAAGAKRGAPRGPRMLKDLDWSLKESASSTSRQTRRSQPSASQDEEKTPRTTSLSPRRSEPHSGKLPVLSSYSRRLPESMKSPDSPARRGSPKRKNAPEQSEEIPVRSSPCRPKRKSAPTFLGENASSIEAPLRSSPSRPKRSSAPTFLGEDTSSDSDLDELPVGRPKKKNAPIIGKDAEPELPTPTSVDTRPLVFPEDKPLISDYIYFALEQMAPCKLTEADKNHSQKTREVNCLGLACKHCLGLEKSGSGKYFPDSEAALLQTTTSRTIVDHVLNCSHCPMEIRERLETMKRESIGPDGKRVNKPKHGGRKEFFHRLWRRIQDIHFDELGVAYGRRPSARPKRKSAPNYLGENLQRKRRRLESAYNYA